jgi:hypothetical protein
MTAAILAGTIPTLSAAETIQGPSIHKRSAAQAVLTSGREMGTLAEIIELRPRETGLDDQIFNAACEMEGDLRAIDGFADALVLVSETMDDANAIIGLTWEIKHRAQRMEARRDNFFTRVLPNSGLTSARSN